MPSHLVRKFLFLGCDSLNLQQSQIIVPETTAPTTKAAVVILKKRFHTSALILTYCSSDTFPSAALARCICGIKTIATKQIATSTMNFFIYQFDVVSNFYLRVLKIFRDLQVFII